MKRLMTLERPSVFWVPRPARWEKLRAAATPPRVRHVRGRRNDRHEARGPERDVLLSQFASAGGQSNHG